MPTATIQRIHRARRRIGPSGSYPGSINNTQLVGRSISKQLRSPQSRRAVIPSLQLSPATLASLLEHTGKYSRTTERKMSWMYTKEGDIGITPSGLRSARIWNGIQRLRCRTRVFLQMSICCHRQRFRGGRTPCRFWHIHISPLRRRHSQPHHRSQITHHTLMTEGTNIVQG